MFTIAAGSDNALLLSFGHPARLYLGIQVDVHFIPIEYRVLYTTLFKGLIYQCHFLFFYKGF